MPITYYCDEHGVVSHCDTTESGERACPECGEFIKGAPFQSRGYRAPPSDKPNKQIGDIGWVAVSGPESVHFSAFDYIDAIETAFEHFDRVSDVYPRERNHR